MIQTQVTAMGGVTKGNLYKRRALTLTLHNKKANTIPIHNRINNIKQQIKLNI